MTQPEQAALQLAREALSALQAGDAALARELFGRVVSSPAADASAWLGLAFSCTRLGDGAAALDAVNQALEREPRNLRALLFKADHLAATTQNAAAIAFYRAALKVAAGVNPVPPDIVRGLQRAKAIVGDVEAKSEQHLMASLKQRGYRPGVSSPRFTESLEISFGRKQVFHQSPTKYYFPGLPQIQFFEREQFPWVDAIERATDDIRAELRHLLRDRSRFTPYLNRDPNSPELNDRSQLDNPDWSACYLWKDGQLQPDNASTCPRTLQALQTLPIPMIPGRSPNVLFSKLNPRTHIPAHTGFLNSRLICHLPLIVPQNCGALRCGNATRAWKEGEILIFDDSIEHEAWNDSAEERVILLFEIWRPELSDEERALVSAMLEITTTFTN